MAPNVPTPPDDELPTANWHDPSTRGLSSTGDHAVPPAEQETRKDFSFPPSHGNSEPATVFDPNETRPPREMKIAREGEAQRLPEGHIINERFEIRKCLGDGNVGTVYLVDDLRLKDKKALKLMHATLVDSEIASQRFISEIKTLQKLSHEHIIRVYDYGKAEVSELSFFTMEYVDGNTLAQLLKKRGGKLPLDKAVALTTQILETLAYAHQHTTHRNLKPINIMVRRTGNIVLLNFGISTTASSAGLTPAPVRLGSSPYQAPEQRENPEAPDKRVDIYAAGATLYQMLTGNVPLDNPKPPSRLNRTLPKRLDRVVMKCLAPEPAQRYQSADEMRRAIERAIAPVNWPLRVTVLTAILTLLVVFAWIMLR